MLKSIEICNFRKHRKSIFELVNGFNAIVGISNSGKSSSIHSLHWTIKNRPSGFDFRSWNARSGEFTSVNMVFDDGWVIRERNKTTNQYRWSGSDEPSKALKGRIPEEINSFINLNDLNFQSQHDTYYLLQDSPGEVARKLNDIVGISIIDKTIKAINSIVSDAKSKSEEEAIEVKKKEKELEQFDNLESIQLLIEDIEKDDAYLSEVEDKIVSTNEIIESINAIQDDIISAKNKLKSRRMVDALLSDSKIINELYYDIEDTQNLLNEISMIQEDIEECNEFLKHKSDIEECLLISKEIEIESKKIESIGSLLFDILEVNNSIEECKDYLSVKPTVLELIEESDSIIESNKRIKSTKTILDSMSDIQKKIALKTMDLNIHKVKYNDILTKGGQCPTCGKPMTTQELERMISDSVCSG